MMHTTLSQIYEPMLLALFGISALVAIVLMWINAPYGRHLRSGWGPTIPARAGWIIMETPAVVAIALMFIWSDRHFDPVSIAFLALWQSHYLYRTYVFPFRLRAARKPMPILIILMAITFNCWNGFLNGAWLFHLSPERDISWWRDLRFIFGTALFFVGMIINRQSDAILLRLRAPGETGYKIPHGGMYRWISMPSYFGELVQWVGFALATWSLAGLAFAVFTAANLVPRAVANHRWYRQTFADYPQNRKAVIPFVL